jgi:hypothetical protein
MTEPAFFQQTVRPESVPDLKLFYGSSSEACKESDRLWIFRKLRGGHMLIFLNAGAR